MKRIAIALVVSLSFSLAAFAQQQNVNLNDYDVLLVPVFFFGAGAHGSDWETRIDMVSSDEATADMPVPLFNEPFEETCGTPDGRIEPRFTRSVCREFASPAGLLVYVPREVDQKKVQFKARIRDLSRQATSAGTEIPVLRESDFRVEPFYLLNVPSDARFRANLRVYGGLETFSPEFRFIYPSGGVVGLEIYDSRDLLTPIVNTTLDLSAPQSIEGSGVLTQPAYVSIGDLVATYPQLANVPEYTIRIEPYQSIVDPPREESVWAFVSITNNDTEQVTTITP